MKQKRYQYRAGDQLEYLPLGKRFTCAVDEDDGVVHSDDSAGEHYQANACRLITPSTDEARTLILRMWAGSNSGKRAETARKQLGDSAPTLDPKGKAGSLKCPMHLLPPSAMRAAAWAHKHGAEKYDPYNWRKSKVCITTYVAAIMRHMDAYRDGEDLDPDSGLPHTAHVIASCNILIDAGHCGTLVDDRHKTIARITHPPNNHKTMTIATSYKHPADAGCVQPLVRLRCPDCKTDIERDSSLPAYESIKCPRCERYIMGMFWITLSQPNKKNQ